MAKNEIETAVDEIRRAIADSKAHREARLADYRQRQIGGRALYLVNGLPTLRPSFVIYLDELGTSARLPLLTDEMLREDLATYDKLRCLLLDEESEIEAESARGLYFSDNVAVVTPYEPRDRHFPDFGLHRQLLAVVVYQLNMMRRGRALRGGLAAGMAYADHSFVTGPAHLVAVKLEEERAKNPRVLLDSQCLGIVEKTPSDTQEFLQHYLLRDVDGEVFVNYLRGIEEDGIPEEIDQGLIEHRDVLSEALTKTAASPTVHGKYVWAAGYHNYACRTFYKTHGPGLEVSGIAPGQLSKLT